MNESKTRPNWKMFLKFYSHQNKGRKTRLGVFENVGDVVNDYWIEDGMPLEGFDIDVNGALPTVEIILGKYSHFVINVRSLRVYYSFEGNEDGVDIAGADGKTTVLRFENE